MTKTADAAVGMMDTAYFVGRGELLEFFNQLLGLQLAKIEQTASGAVACQLTEYIFPGSIPMSKVNWEAKSDYEFISNYKLLQAAFTKNHVQRHVDVDKLVRAKYQDNLEFCQWLKAFYDQSGAIREDYDPVAVRARGKGGKKYNTFLDKTASKHGSKPLPSARPTGRTPIPVSSPARKTKPATSSTRPTTTRPTVSSRTGPGAKAPLKESRNQQEAAVVDAELTKKNKDLTTKLKDLELTVVELEKERDFYFGKLRNVELMLQVQQDNGWEDCELQGVVDNIFKVLYATAEEDVTVNENGEIIPAAELEAMEPSAVDISLAVETEKGEDENLLTDDTP